MYHGNSSMKNRMYIDEQAYYEQMAEIKDSTARLSEYHRSLRVATDCGKADKLAEKAGAWECSLIRELSVRQRTFLMEMVITSIIQA